MLALLEQAEDGHSHLSPSVNQIGIVLSVFGPIFPNADAPPVRFGDQSGYDAALYLGGLITAISIQPDSSAGASLSRLLKREDLASYRLLISNRLAEQREINRRSRYEMPTTWDAVCTALKGGAPANIEDLKALFLGHLIDVAKDIRDSNTDQYRVYWSGGKHESRVPQDEEYCRDRLLDYLRERFARVGLRVEPEGHMAADKRADIVVFDATGLKLPVEVKRDTHPDLWVAALGQLDHLYTRDPGAQGYGVYLVLYFGVGRRGKIPRRPDGARLIESPVELENALNTSIPAEQRSRITCVVVDVSPPALPESSTPKVKRRKVTK